MTISLRGAASALVCLAAIALTGCPPKPARVCPAEYYGVEQLVGQYNANAQKVPQLWARTSYQIKLTDEKGKVQSFSGLSGHLLLLKRADDPLGPQYFLLSGRHDLGGKELFRLGADPSEGVYYFWYDISAENRGARVGELANLNRAGSETMGFNPNELLGVLGVLPWQANLDQLPYPVMTSLLDPCMYVMQFLAPRPGKSGLYVEREVWLDRYDRHHWPMRVRLYEPDGRNVMDARLDKYQPIETSGAKADWPVMPTDIQIDWPLAKSSMRLQLSGVTTEPKRADGSPLVLRPAVFGKNIPRDIPLQEIQQVGQAVEETPRGPALTSEEATQPGETQPGATQEAK